MATDAKSHTKITYATMSGDRMADLHRELDRAIEQVKAAIRQALSADDRRSRGLRRPASSTIGARSTRESCWAPFNMGGREHVRDAVAAARAAYPAWSARPWRERVALLKKVADGIRARRWELSALMGYEAGKNRLECVGDVEESADLIEYYCHQMEQHDGFSTRLGSLGPNEENASVLRPYGVWAVISPFNFPLALAAGPAGGALVAGNTVVFKPASATPAARLRAVRGDGGGGDSARGLQLHHRKRQHRGTGARRQPRRGRHRLHRVERRRDAPDSRQRRARRSRGRSSSRWGARTRRSSCRPPISTRRATA